MEPTLLQEAGGLVHDETSCDTAQRELMRVLIGSAGIACFLIYYAVAWYDGHAVSALWACHLASLLTGSGLLFRRPSLIGIGVLWLLIGIPMWFIYLAIGEPFRWPSLFTHFGGFAVGCWGLKVLRMPRGLWWKAMVGMWLLLGVSRLVSSPEWNVNLSFHVYQTGDPFAGFYPAALVVLSLGSLFLFYLGEQLLIRFEP